MFRTTCASFGYGDSVFVRKARFGGWLNILARHKLRPCLLTKQRAIDSPAKQLCTSVSEALLIFESFDATLQNIVFENTFWRLPARLGKHFASCWPQQWLGRRKPKRPCAQLLLLQLLRDSSLHWDKYFPTTSPHLCPGLKLSSHHKLFEHFAHVQTSAIRILHQRIALSYHFSQCLSQPPPTVLRMEHQSQMTHFQKIWWIPCKVYLASIRAIAPVCIP